MENGENKWCRNVHYWKWRITGSRKLMPLAGNGMKISYSTEPHLFCFVLIHKQNRIRDFAPTCGIWICTFSTLLSVSVRAEQYVVVCCCRSKLFIQRTFATFFFSQSLVFILSFRTVSSVFCLRLQLMERPAPLRSFCRFFFISFFSFSLPIYRKPSRQPVAVQKIDAFANKIYRNGRDRLLRIYL